MQCINNNNDNDNDNDNNKIRVTFKLMASQVLQTAQPPLKGIFRPCWQSKG